MSSMGSAGEGRSNSSGGGTSGAETYAMARQRVLVEVHRLRRGVDDLHAPLAGYADNVVHVGRHVRHALARASGPVLVPHVTDDDRGLVGGDCAGDGFRTPDVVAAGVGGKIAAPEMEDQLALVVHSSIHWCVPSECCYIASTSEPVASGSTPIRSASAGYDKTHSANGCAAAGACASCMYPGGRAPDRSFDCPQTPLPPAVARARMAVANG